MLHYAVCDPDILCLAVMRSSPSMMMDWGKLVDRSSTCALAAAGVAWFFGVSGIACMSRVYQNNSKSEQARSAIGCSSVADLARCLPLRVMRPPNMHRSCQCSL